MTRFQEDFKFELSVIICAYNEESHLLKCLESLKHQNYDKAKFEIIIMDNESDDRTPKIAKEFTKHNKSLLNVQYFRIKHVGLSASRNTGISLAQGKIISFVDGDAIVDEECVQNILTPFKLDDQASIVCGRVKNLENGSFFSRFIFYAHYEAGIKSRINDVLGSLVGANMAFHRRVFDSTGGFFNGFTLYGDESSVARKYLSSFPNAAIFHAKKAVVFNEHPDSLIVWLKQRFFQGRMLFLINLHVAELNIFKLFFKVLIKLIGMLSLTILLFQPFIKAPSEIIYVLIFLIFLVISARFKYLINSFIEVSSNINIFSGFISIFVCISGNIMGDIGFFREALVSFAGRQIDMSNSVSEVTESS